MSTAPEAGGRLSLHRDEWLTRMLGRPAWHVGRGGGEPLATLAAASPSFAYAKVDTADVAALWSLTESGFRVVDTALTFESLQPLERLDTGVRHAAPADCSAVGRLAASSFRYSRFHLDPRLPLDAAHAIKAEWATNYFRGSRGDGMVVAERGGSVVGFNLLLWQPGDRLAIDLIAVDEACRGLGLASAMIGYAWRHGTGDGRVPQRLRVGTQAANVPSIRLYESLGFRLIASQYVLHYHGPTDRAA